MKLNKLFISLAASLLIITSGCTVHVSTNYAPSVNLDGKGEVTIEKFTFQPDGYIYDERDNLFKSVNSRGTLRNNEIYIGAPASILLEKPVGEFITEAVAKEFKFIGYRSTQNSLLKITGKIRNLAIEKGFFSSDFVTLIEFSVINSNDGKVYTKLSEGRFTMSELHTKEPTKALYTSISKSIEGFVRSAQENEVLQR